MSIVGIDSPRNREHRSGDAADPGISESHASTSDPAPGEALAIPRIRERAQTDMRRRSGGIDRSNGDQVRVTSPHDS
jgi:hypothetical protein